MGPSQTTLTSPKEPALRDGTEGHLRFRRLAFNCRYLHSRLNKLGFITYGHPSAPIVPLLVFNLGKLPLFHRMMKDSFVVVLRSRRRKWDRSMWVLKCVNRLKDVEHEDVHQIGCTHFVSCMSGSVDFKLINVYVGVFVSQCGKFCHMIRYRTIWRRYSFIQLSIVSPSDVSCNGNQTCCKM
jgi:hypothetical protein